MMYLEGEIKQITNFKTKNGNNIETLHVLHWTGKSFDIARVTNFTNQTFKEGPATLSIVPKVTAIKDRAFLNLTAYEGKQGAK